MPAPLRFCFDFISPYAYLAWHGIHDLADHHGREVEPVPVLFAALLNHHGNVGPAEIPAKRVYVFKDALRHAARLGLHLEPPPTHPFNPLPALRLCCLELPPETRRELVTRLFERAWGGAGGLEDLAGLQALCRELGIADAAARIQDPEIKERLKARTAEAIEAGVFGVPTVLAEGELFWGFDSFVHLDRFLAGEDPDLAGPLARWADLKASARRR